MHQRSSARPRIVYADLDGTLLGPGGSLFAGEGRLSRSAADAVAALHESGVELVLMSGRTRAQLREAARILGATAFIAELGGFVVETRRSFEPVPSFGAFTGRGTPHAAIARSGAPSFLMQRFPARLEPHAPWAFQGREVSVLLRGRVDPGVANSALRDAGYSWLRLIDNGRVRTRSAGLDVEDPHAYHLLPVGVSKAAGVRLHLDRRGMSGSEAVAIGDSPADSEVDAVVGRMFRTNGDRTFDDAVREVLR